MRHSRKPPKNPLDHEPVAVTYAREKAGLTKTALAKRIGRSLSLVSEIEAGTRNATPEVINLIADACNCPRVILERKRDPQNEPKAAPPTAGTVPAVRDTERPAGRAQDVPELRGGSVRRSA